MLTKQRPATAARALPVAPAASPAPGALDRRGFLRTSGLAAGGLAALGGLGMTTVQQATAGEVEPGVPTQTRKTVCTHCSVGCSVLAKVQNGVWVAQEANFDSPNNLGTHCAKGAAVRELTHGDRRLKYPMKLEGGQWKRLSWEQAISEIGDKMLAIREKSGPDSVFWLGSAKFSNEGAYSILQLALGNMGQSGGGTNIFRGHCNVQGATDMGLDVTTLPAYLGLDEAAWKHFARVWDLEYDYLVSRFASKKLMETKGIPSTRWFDAVLADKDTLDQPDNVRAMVAWGHAANSITREPVMRQGMNKLDLLLVVDPHPTTFAISGDRKDGTYLLPACTQFEQSGTVTGSNRSIQWREQVVKPIFESKQDTEIMLLLEKKFGFAEQLVKNIAVEEGVPVSEDILREINRGCFAIGYSGQSPERLKLHAKHQADFDPLTLQATSGPCAEEYYGLPWPCWGTPELKHPGTGFLYNTAVPVKEGGSGFRARWGVEREGVSLLATDYPKGSEIKGGYPEFTVAVLKKLGWDGELTEAERAVIDKIGGNNVSAVSWQTDLSGGIQRVAISHGCAPFGNGKARAFAWNLVDPVPIHREPIRTPRRDLIDKYPALADRRDYRLPYLGRR